MEEFPTDNRMPIRREAKHGVIYISPCEISIHSTLLFECNTSARPAAVKLPFTH